MNTHDTLNTNVVIVGGGIAGCWTAIKLLRLGFGITLVYYGNTDRGGRLGATNQCVGAISTSPLAKADYSDWLDELGRGQGNLDIGDITRKHLASELDELLEFDPLKAINLGVALKSGSGRLLLKRLLKEIEILGGRVLSDAWVTRIVVRDGLCQGIQYERNGLVGAIHSDFTVLASGGYASLFEGSVKTGSYGSIHGRLLMAGGLLSNMEFIFKHGYGQPDVGMLTPTEELPGVEIYDEHGKHVTWLENELFLGRGTSNHFQAFLTWRKGQDLSYFVDFRYRDLYRALKQLATEPGAPNSAQAKHDLIVSLLDRCPPNHKLTLASVLEEIAAGTIHFDYPTFGRVKELVSEQYPIARSRIRQISYFSMGGIANNQFMTNIENLFVCGEAMHDYGAFRVGGLPWALYLCAAKIIAQNIDFMARLGHVSTTEFPLQNQSSKYDERLIRDIQAGLHQYQENGLNIHAATKFAHWLRDRRLSLISRDRTLDDSVAYLATAEAIMRSSLARQESRGCFIRDDYTDEDAGLSTQYTLTSYNSISHDIEVRLIERTTLSHVLCANHQYRGTISMDNATETKNAAYFLVKKHLDSGLAANTAIETLSESYTYRDLWALCNRYAAVFQTSGIHERDRVAFLLSDRPEYIAMFLAMQQIGAIAVPLNTFSKPHELIHYLNDCGAKLIVSEPDLLAKHSLEEITEQTSCRVLTYDSLAESEVEPISDILPVNDDTAGFILYTSGTTGAPKGAVHKQASMRQSAASFASECLGMTAEDRVFSTSKLFFAYGLGNSLYFPLYFGATIILESGKATPEVITEILLTLHPTLFFSVPAAYADILKNGGATNTLFGSVRLCVSAGEALPPAIARSWIDNTDIDIIDGIGSTEAVHIFCVTRHSSQEQSHFGIPVRGYTLEVVNERNEPVERNTIGDLRIKGPTITLGYWNAPEKTRDALRDNSLLTGDRYFANDRGEFVFVGRNRDTYKSSGLWVSTLEIESVINELEQISECSVVVYQGNDGLLRSKAYLVARNASTFDENSEVEMSTRSHLKSRLPKHKLPHSIEIIDNLPRTATGKVAKSLLVERAQEVIWREEQNA